MKPANLGPFYAAGLYPQIAEICRKHGYALAVHGSLARDFDLIAVPWVETVSEPREVVDELQQTFAFCKGHIPPEGKPHGRIGYSIPFSFGECRMDISFTMALRDAIAERTK